MIKISHYFISLFSNYSFYQGEHLEVLLSVDLNNFFSAVRLWTIIVKPRLMLYVHVNSSPIKHLKMKTSELSFRRELWDFRIDEDVRYTIQSIKWKNVSVYNNKYCIWEKYYCIMFVSLIHPNYLNFGSTVYPAF